MGKLLVVDLTSGELRDEPLDPTMAHAFVTAFDSEVEAFRAYAATFPHNTIFLIDTYDTIAGARNAANVALEMQALGHKALGVRLDSGNMIELSRDVRRILDEAGLPEMKIFASSSFDEFKITEIVQSGAPIDAFGVGTRVGVSADAPYLDIVYKLVRLGNRNIRKLSPGKVTLAGEKQIFRRLDPRGMYGEDIITCREETMANAQPLLEPVMAKGQKVKPTVSLNDIRKNFKKDFAHLDQRYKNIHGHEAFPVRISAKLNAMQK